MLGFNPDEIARHPDVQKAYEYYARGVFHIDGSLVFWTNDLEPDPRNPREKIHWGKRVAERYCAASRGRAHIMGEFETVGGIAGSLGLMSLDKYERRDDIPPKIKEAVPVAASYSFAKSASGTAIVSAKGAYHYSYFREIEIDALMTNDRVTDICCISRDLPPEGRTYPKHEAYHLLCDEWLQCSYDRCITAKRAFEANPADVDLRDNYNKTLEDLASEVLIARGSLARPYPLDARGTDGRAREEARVRVGEGFVRDFPALHGMPSLQDKLDHPEAWERPSEKRAVIAALDREYAGITPEEIRRATTTVLPGSPPRDPGIVIIRRERAAVAAVRRGGVASGHVGGAPVVPIGPVVGAVGRGARRP